MPTRKRLAPQQTPATASPVAVRKAHPLAWRKALSLAEGDPRRLTVLDDGAVLVERIRG